MADNRLDIRSIFGEALGKGSPDEVVRFLDDACGDDKKLRSEVEELLRLRVRVLLARELERHVEGNAPCLVISALVDTPCKHEGSGQEELTVGAGIEDSDRFSTSLVNTRLGVLEVAGSVEGGRGDS